ncbi:MAG: hypothetical protein IPL79_05580 [Myxococcales bacterium]|nr:hypothetical protein [Myxococcales bacterium]
MRQVSRKILMFACGLVAVLATLPAREAWADLVSVRLELHGGVARGKGLSGERKTEAFAENAPRNTAGVVVGAEVAFLDVWISHDQFRGDNRTATWTAAGLGFDIELPLGDKLYASAGIAGGLGLGTGQQVNPPLDAAQVSDKGAFGEAKAELGIKLGAGFRLGIAVPFTYGYYLKTGDGDVANDMTTHYTASQLQGLVTLGWKFKAI